MRIRSKIVQALASGMALLPSAAWACSCSPGPFTEKDFADSTVLELEIGEKTWGSMLCGISRSYESRTAVVKRVTRGPAPRTKEIVLGNALSFRPGYCKAEGSACQFTLTPGVSEMVVSLQPDGTYRTTGVCSQFAWAEARDSLKRRKSDETQ